MDDKEAVLNVLGFFKDNLSGTGDWRSITAAVLSVAERAGIEFTEVERWWFGK